MKLYVPYASNYLVGAALGEISGELGVDVEFGPMGRKVRLRNAAPGVKGIPHLEVSGLKLRAQKGNDRYRKFSNERRTVGICWHGHKMFMERVFAAFDNATLLTALAKYYGKESFDTLHHSTNDQQWNNRSHCACWSYSETNEGLTVYHSDI